MRDQQLEGRAGVGLRLRQCAAAESDDAAVSEHERDGRERDPLSCIGEHPVQHRVGEVERLRGHEADEEHVQRRRDVELLFLHQPAPGESTFDDGGGVARGLAAPGALEGEGRQDQALARRRALEAGMALEASGRGAAGLAARLLGVRAEVRLDEQRELAVGRFDDSDRRLQGLDGAVRLPRPRERVAEQADRPRDQLGFPEDVDRPGEVPSRLRCRDAQLGGSELEEHDPRRPRRRRFGERSAQPGDRGSGCPAPEGLVGHAAQELDPRRVPDRLRLGDLRGDPFRRGAARGEDAGRPGVRLGPLVRPDVRVDRFAHDRVGELQHVPGGQDLELGQQVVGPGRLVLRDPGEACRLGEAGAVTQHRHGTHEIARGRRCVGHAEQDRLGDGGWPDTPHPRRLPGVGHDPLPAGLAQQRLQEERVAPSGLPARRRELGGDVGAEAETAQRRRARGGQRARAQDGRLRCGGEPGQVGVGRRAGTGGAQEGQGQTVQPGGQVDEETQ